jgi:DNA helicase-2/ATP-dependent DNA helicase PcrA
MTGPSVTRAQLDSALRLQLTDEQWLAVAAPIEPAVIVAGAGSGKTTAMAARVAWLVGNGHVRPDAVLGLTFTTKATAALLTSMRASLAALMTAGLVTEQDDEPLGDPQVLTYHAFAARIVAEHGIRLGREPGPTMLTEGRRQQLGYRLVCRTTLPLAQFGRSPVDIAGDLLSLDDELCELGIEPDALRDFDAEMLLMLRSYEPLQVIGRAMQSVSSQRAVLADLVLEWRAEKAARDVMDFADQIRLAGDLVAAYPDVVAELRGQFPVVLLDEYQDTSIAQRVLLQRIFDGGHSVMAVGDPCQAIYGWRGASVDNIESFPAHFPVLGPAAAVAESAGGVAFRPASRYSLSQNRRSGPAILEIANRASAHLRSVHTGVAPLRAGDNGKGRGAVSCALFATYADEIAWVVQQIAATHDGGALWSDIAVLAATGRDLVAVESALRHAAVPTQLVGAAALLSQPAVIELRSMLEVIHDPTANAAFIRIATGPRWRIGVRDLAALGSRAAHVTGGRQRSQQEDLDSALDDAVVGSDPVELVSLTEVLGDLGDEDRFSVEACQRFRAMSQELSLLRRHVGEPLGELILRVLRVSGLEIEASLGTRSIAGQQQHALAAFLDLAADFTDLDGRMSLGAFLGLLRDAERFDVNLSLDVTGPADAVQLLTVHKAKGLEFGYVFVPFMSEGAFPGGRGRSQWPTSARSVPWPLREDCTDDLASFPVPGEGPRAKQHDEYKQVLKAVTDLENERLAYVAFTRAERGLAVSGHWWGPSQATRRGPHPYLRTVHEACLEGLGLVDHWAEPPAEADANPTAVWAGEPVAWPVPATDEATESRRAVADAVRSAHQPELPGFDLPGRQGMGPHESERMRQWDLLAAALVEEERRRQATVRVVPLPTSVSASVLMHALSDPTSVAMDLARPMPRPPAPAARRGTAFHAWVETRFGQQSLLDPDDLPGAADDAIGSDADLAALKAAFEAGPWARRDPLAVEVPFALLVGGRVVNGRIDAVFESACRFDVIDWKTGSARSVDAMQLAIYRLAWSQLRGVPIEDVDGAFVLVSTGEVFRPDTSAEVGLLRRGTWAE